MASEQQVPALRPSGMTSMFTRRPTSGPLQEVETLFVQLGSEVRKEAMNRATRFVCYAAPGIEKAEASVLADAARRLGPASVSVSLDFSESVVRMGYGDLDSVQFLRHAGVDVRSCPGLRVGLFVVDGCGFLFTPLARYLENEPSDRDAPNAVSLSRDAVQSVMARLSPAAHAIALSNAAEPSERERLEDLEVEVQSHSVEESQVAEIADGLAKAPPVPFDLARQVRVYTAHLQYGEFKLTGTAIQRRRIVLPKTLVGLGADPELDERLRTTFDLIKKTSDLSSKALDQQLKRIRETYTQRLDDLHGRVFLRSDKPEIEARLSSFRKLLDDHRARVMKDLKARLDESRSDITDYFEPKVIAAPPAGLSHTSPSGDVTPEAARSWIDQQLQGVFPSPEEIVQKMKLDVLYRDITFENLDNEDFRLLVRAAFPTQDWDRLHDEFVAAGAADSATSPG